MRMPPPPPMLQPYEPTRGFISCFNTQHSVGADDAISAATDETLRDLLADLYEEAFRRLPVVGVPVDVDLAGLCLGLLDPVTNIILNAISLLPHGFETTNPSVSVGMPSPRRRHERSRDEWRAVAWKSSRCLLEFMRAYFGLLTQEQAGRYLVWARADLAMAVLLVEHELYAAPPAQPDPRSGRTRNSLRIAATHGSHPAPDHLVSLATAWLPQQRLEMLAPILSSRNRLTVQDIKTLLHALRQKDNASAMSRLEECTGLAVEGTTSCADLGEGRISITTIVQRAGDHIVSLRRPQETQSMLSSYSTHANTVTVLSAPGTTTKPLPRDLPCTSIQSMDADACPYFKSLEMCLYGTIHGFYLRALAMLPSHHIRGVLVAGHCYGPMDPVSNIVLSALWFDTNFPLPMSDQQRMQSHDILDTLTMLRAVSRSLRGLVALLHATSGQQLSLHDILKYLCYAQGDLSTMLQPHLHRRRLDESSPNPFATAATAAQHPQASAMAAFFVTLAPMKLDRLRALMGSVSANNNVLSQESLTEIYSILREETLAMMIKPTLLPPSRLCGMALIILTRKRNAYAQQQAFIRGKIEQALQEYASHNPSEPKYDLNFVCGVAIAGHMDQCYHVNFMAATKSRFKQSTLFFAEFRLGYQDQSKPSICCPLPQPYDTGRCYYGQESARKIAYPDHLVDYFSSDITRGGLNDTEGVLDTDFIYFDYERDVELTKVLQRMAKKEEVMQRSSTGFRAEWSTPVFC